jgi:nicotinate-nucleotide--dimethylbenzimidazole phosphoribosyltransferase
MTNSADLLAAARRAMDDKTKPPGSLGRLEDWAVQIAVLQQTLAPRVERSRVIVFGADHGVATEGVSAYPSQVTGEMMRNFGRGGAAINCLARSNRLDLEVVDVGVDADLSDIPVLVHAKVRHGSRNFLREPALTAGERQAAWQVGAAAVERARASGAQAVGLGEMGIGNTTAAAALLSALTGEPPERTVGRGTGMDEAGLAHKREVVAAALERHRPSPEDPLGCLEAVGGLELAALAGAATAAARHRLAVMADGFISTVAILAASVADPQVRPALFFAHRSAELGHQTALRWLGAEPLFELDMRLGEGTGAALALPVLRAAADLMREMATFSQAGISQAL